MRYATKVLKNELKIVKRNVDYWKEQQGKQDCKSMLQEFIIAERELQQAIAHLQSVEPAAQPPTQQGSEPAEICPKCGDKIKTTSLFKVCRYCGYTTLR